MKEKIAKIEFVSTIQEMSPELLEESSTIPVNKTLLNEVTEDDPSPKFVLSFIEEQMSRKKVNYDRKALQLVADQVNETQPTGYLGHIKDTDKDYVLPTPQVIWLGSAVINRGGKAVLATKGYLYPEGQARSLIKRHGINTVSWSGEGSLVPSAGGTFELKSFKLESIDFARKNREGMPVQNLVLVNEMMSDSDDKRKGGKMSDRDDRDDVEAIVGRITATEFKTMNPAVYRSIIEMGKDEANEVAKETLATREKELKEESTKAVASVPEISMMQKIRDLFGIKDDDTTDPVEAVSTLLKRLDDAGRSLIQSWFNEEVLAKKVPDPRARSLVSRLIPISEMGGDYRTERGLEAIKKNIAEKADELIEGDEAIQTVINEMGSGRGGLRFGSSGHQNSDRDDDRGKNDDDPDQTAAKKKYGLKNAHVEFAEIS
jgi:hypothetical protein